MFICRKCKKRLWWQAERLKSKKTLRVSDEVERVPSLREL